MVISKETKCSFATANLMQRIGRLRCAILETDVTRYRVSDSSISNFHESINIMIKTDIPQIEKFCRIEMVDAEKSLKTLKDSLPKINEGYTRNFMHGNIGVIEEKLTGKY